jgi:hypothetical protein
MKLENLIAVSGLPGLYRMAANRSNGLIIEDLKTGKRSFASSRKHQFTPLESIAVYTADEEDSTELKNVFRSMYQLREDHPPISLNAETAELNAYFAQVLPNYDRDRVSVTDIKKIIKWFNFLDEVGALQVEDEAEAAAEEEE